MGQGFPNIYKRWWAQEMLLGGYFISWQDFKDA